MWDSNLTNGILSSLFSFKRILQRIPQTETFVSQKDTYVHLTESVYVTFNGLRWLQYSFLFVGSVYGTPFFLKTGQFLTIGYQSSKNSLCLVFIYWVWREEEWGHLHKTKTLKRLCRGTPNLSHALTLDSPSFAITAFHFNVKKSWHPVRTYLTKLLLRLGRIGGSNVHHGFLRQLVEFAESGFLQKTKTIFDLVSSRLPSRFVHSTVGNIHPQKAFPMKRFQFSTIDRPPETLKFQFYKTLDQPYVHLIICYRFRSLL